MAISSNFHILPQTMVKGDIIRLKNTLESHHNGEPPYRVPEDAAVNFGEMLNRALEKVNDQQIESEGLMQQMVADPQSVSVHTVRIAMEKARMSLNFTKTVSDIAIQGYKELVNMR